MREQLPQKIYNWLKDRGISGNIIDLKLDWNGSHIVIPIFDKNKHLLFNKYRRNPASLEGPKYTYDKGGTSSLYGIEFLDGASSVFIVEGELDVLLLNSLGYNAVSSTGGSATFKAEWAEEFKNKEVFICYDSDEPGIRGAFNVQLKIPWAKIIWLEKEYKDITEFYISTRGEINIPLLRHKAQSYEIPSPLAEVPKTKKEMKAILKADIDEVERLMKEAQVLRGEYKSDKHLKILINYYMTRINQNKKTLRFMGVNKVDKVKYGNRIAQAKQTPIEKYVKFNREKFGFCLWHADSHPSMYYYEKQNRVKCFSCGKFGDVIDVVQKVYRVEIKEALDIILK